MKYLIGFALIAALAVSVCGYNATWGTKGPSDPLLFKQQILKPGKFNVVQSHNFTFPAKALANQRIISQVRALDFSRYQTGGTPTLYKGGPGFKMVTIMMRSQPSQGLNLTVEIYARR